MAIPMSDYEQSSLFRHSVRDSVTRIKPTSDTTATTTNHHHHHDDSAFPTTGRPRLLVPFGVNIWTLVCHDEDDNNNNKKRERIHYPQGIRHHNNSTDVAVGQRFVVISLEHGCWIWCPSAVPWSRSLQDEIVATCGTIRHMVIPNRLHRHSAEWSMRNPLAKLYAPPSSNEDNDGDGDGDGSGGLAMDFLLSDEPNHEYQRNIDQVIFRGSYVEEAVFYHRDSGTVLFGDLLQHNNSMDSTSLDDGETPVMTASSSSSSRRSNAMASSFWNRLLESTMMTPRTAMTTPMLSAYKTPAAWQFSYWWHSAEEDGHRALAKVLHEWRPRHMIVSCGPPVRDGAIASIQKGFAWLRPPRRTGGADNNDGYGGREEEDGENDHVPQGMLNKIRLTTGS